MRKFIASAAAVATLATAFAAPEMAQARHHYYHHYYRQTYYHNCHRERRHAANQGTVIGAIGGGILGNVIAGRHSRTAGTLIGAGVGAVAGHQIARNQHRC